MSSGSGGSPPLETTQVPYQKTTQIFKNYASTEHSFSSPGVEELHTLQAELDSFKRAAEVRRAFFIKNLGIMQTWIQKTYPDHHQKVSSTEVEKTREASIVSEAEIPLSPAPPPVVKLESSSSSTVFTKPPTKAQTPKPRASGGTSGSNTKDKKRRYSKIDDSDVVSQAGSTADLIESQGIFNGDYSKVKVTSQVPLAQFYTYMDHFFRPLTEDDLQYLDAKMDEVTPFITPDLGKHYLEQWATEDNAGVVDGGIIPETSGVKNFQLTNSNKQYQQLEDTVYPGKSYFGPIWERIVSSLLQDPYVSPLELTTPVEEDLDDDTSLIIAPIPKERSKLDMMDLEDRLRQELRHIGLLGDSDLDATDSQDNEDEVAAELNKLQKELRDQISINKKRKQKVADLTRQWMAWQEYNNLLDDLNKQVETAYIKRFRSKSKKKKKDGLDRPFPDHVLDLLEQRSKLIKTLGTVFNIKRFTMPSRSIFEEPSEENDQEEDEQQREEYPSSNSNSSINLSSANAPSNGSNMRTT